MRAAREAGFTLLEMIVVLVVLALMASLVVARGPSRSPTLELRATAAEVAATLRGARARAIATNRKVIFRLDVSAHRFAVDDAKPHELSPALGLNLVSVSGLAGIVFAPDGSSTGGEIDLSNGLGGIRIDVGWLSGRVTLADMRANAR